MTAVTATWGPAVHVRRLPFRAPYGQAVSFHPAPLVRVAVLGSCVTRDLFNSRFNPHYKDLFECVALSNQVSLVSLMSPPVDVPADAMAELDDYGRREVTAEVSRSFLTDVVAARPDYLLLDLFADVHFGCFSVAGSHLTRNRWKIMKSRFYAEADKADLVPDDDRETYLAVWRRSLDALLELLARELPDTRLVLHRARNVLRTRNEDGEVRPHGPQARLAEMNAWWDRLDAEVAARGVTRTLDLFSPDMTSADSHPWGPFAVHYTLDYHPAALSKLTQIVLSDARRAAGAGGATSADRSEWPALPERGARAHQTWRRLRRPVLGRSAS